MIPVIIMSVFFIALMYVYYKVSEHGHISPFNKWLLAICSIVILSIVDKAKLLVLGVAFGVMWAYGQIKKRKKDGLA